MRIELGRLNNILLIFKKIVKKFGIVGTVTLNCGQYYKMKIKFPKKIIQSLSFYSVSLYVPVHFV